MKVGMFQSPSEQVLYTGISLIPLNTLGVITSYLRGKGHSVDQYDLNTDLQDYCFDGSLTREDMAFIYDKKAVLDYINGEDVPVITHFIEKLLAGKSLESLEAAGISIGGTFYWMPIHAGFLIGAYLKRKYRIPVVIGGNNMVYLSSFKEVYSELWQAILKNFRFIVLGAGLESFQRILNRVNENPAWIPSKNDRQDVAGLIYMENGLVCNVPKGRSMVVKPDFKGLRLDYYMNYLKDPQDSVNPAEVEQQNLEQLYKWPSDLLEFGNRVYRERLEIKKKGFIKKLVIPYVFSYHCPYKCAFCSESDESNEVVIGDPVQAVEHIEQLVNEYDTPYIQFYNNYFNLSRKFALTFCEEVKKRNLKFYWSDCGRFNGIDPEFMETLRESGCRTLWFGMESASPKMLKMINKKLDLKQIEYGLKICKEAGIWPNLEVIVNFPNESDNDFARTVHFLKRNADKINLFQNNKFYVIPHSEIGKKPEIFNIELVKDVTTYDSLLDANLKWFMAAKDLGAKPNNFHIYPFNEIGGRQYDEIDREGFKRQRYLYQLQRKDFTEIRQMLVLLDALNKKK